ncbi:Uncharacterised protein [Mycobacteroides abscessus subsp. abscessus]|uniref:hypothetical protein n=1 Tax=Mycobacteroides abscessus TaxID=36809 RepID=UPI00092989B6|nr:hypothetical protein [Mycobacteroides abscessus]SHX67341.1 Uncharacterised protein [Mycobacteroides abscessus subsp. abscessus]SIC59155.1 Uncharacterised protein [Mycobacteroides abscessus subsp. abscessus]SKK19999.1 Uncharacterised protein [Mycobacteroides abscessus subsp. abscessus]SKP49829.1 Uncharacterised protein [Mycobacteroides abscessus subsp. abscessus]SKR42140.1 Uncharacterised protein [Mycobacteroides abscessus subsp. abscessus]
MDEALAYKLFGDWSSEHQARGVYIEGDYAPEDEAEEWVEALVGGMVAAMADAGFTVPRGPIRVHDGKVYIELDGDDFMARDIDGEGDRAPASLERILSRFATIAARRGCAQRWFYWYTGDPTGMAYFVTPEELITSAGVDVRELNTGERWYQAQPD